MFLFRPQTVWSLRCFKVKLSILQSDFSVNGPTPHQQTLLPPRTLPVLRGDDPYSAFTTSWAEKITVRELVIQCTAYQPECSVALLCVSVEWKLIHHFRTALSCWGCVGTDAFSCTGTSRLLETQSVKHELRSLGNNDIVWCCRLQNEGWLVSKILLG